MSRKEIDRLSILQRMQLKQLKQIEVAKQLCLSTRQVRRLKQRYREKGAIGLASRRRGKASNNHLSNATKARALELIKRHYLDFGPTLAHEKLTEHHHLKWV